MVQVNGKLIRRSLETHVLRVAKVKLSAKNSIPASQELVKPGLGAGRECIPSEGKPCTVPRLPRFTDEPSTH
jgi:hypothetical protein